MLSGYFPFWGASLLIYFADAEPVLFVPLIEPRDDLPAGLRVQEYPWGDLNGVRIEDNVRVTESCHQVLSTAEGVGEP
jgi:hypothetical protein